MLVTSFVPAVVLVVLAFTDATATRNAIHWSGVRNFSTLSAAGISTIVAQTLAYAGLSTVLAMVLGISMAIVAEHAPPRLRAIAAGIGLVPWTLSTGVIALVWMWLFYDIGGVINRLLIGAALRSEPISWLGLPTTARIALVSANIWRLTPFVALTSYVALQKADKGAIEAATVDGARFLRRTVEIQLPGIRRALAVIALVIFLWSVGEFPLVWVLTRGGPGTATHVINTKAYELAFGGAFAIGLAASCAVLSVPLTASVAAALAKVLRWEQ